MEKENKKLLKLILEKKVELKLVAWASPSVEAYNNNVNKDGWERPLLTEDEFREICEYANLLNISGYEL